MTMILGVEYRRRDIILAEEHIVLPCSAETTLNHGLFPRLVEVRGEAYREFQDAYLAAYPEYENRIALLQDMRPVFSKDGLPIALLLLREDKSSPVDRLQDRTLMFIAACAARGVQSIALSAKAFRGQRVSKDKFEDLCSWLAEAQLHTVVYE